MLFGCDTVTQSCLKDIQHAHAEHEWDVEEATLEGLHNGRPTEAPDRIASTYARCGYWTLRQQRSNSRSLVQVIPTRALPTG